MGTLVQLAQESQQEDNRNAMVAGGKEKLTRIGVGSEEGQVRRAKSFSEAVSRSFSEAVSRRRREHSENTEQLQDLIGGRSGRFDAGLSEVCNVEPEKGHGGGRADVDSTPS